MKKINVSNLRKYLSGLSIQEMTGDIIYLCKNFEIVNDFYQSKINNGFSDQTFSKYKNIIRDEFFPKYGIEPVRLSNVKNTLSEYKKISEDPMSQADLMIYCVEMGVKYTNDYGDIDEKFYDSMEFIFNDALDYIFRNNIQDAFQERCNKIVEETSGIGWGFHDTLADMYFEYYKE